MIPIDEKSYLVVIQRSEGNFGAWAPDLPGCVATGATLEECEQEMRGAISFHLEGLREEGEPVPSPSAAAATLIRA